MISESHTALFDSCTVEHIPKQELDSSLQAGVKLHYGYSSTVKLSKRVEVCQISKSHMKTNSPPLIPLSIFLERGKPPKAERVSKVET